MKRKLWLSGLIGAIGFALIFSAVETAFSVHVNRPAVRPSEADLNEMATIIAQGSIIAIYAGSGCTYQGDSARKRRVRLDCTAN